MGHRRNEEDGSRYPRGFAEALGRTIKVLRTDQRVGRRELAERVGISYSYLTEIENGNKPPSSKVLGPIAAALGLRMSELIEAAEARVDSRQEVANLRFSAHDWAREFGSKPQTPGAGSSAWEGPASPPRHALAMRSSLQPSLREPNSRLTAAMAEFEHLLRTMAPEDIERLLDFARRLAR